jgi:hypothetical protein
MEEEIRKRIERRENKREIEDKRGEWRVKERKHRKKET